jgi:hypothetical protein
VRQPRNLTPAEAHVEWSVAIAGACFLGFALLLGLAIALGGLR